MTTALPPFASIFFRADAENLWAWTVLAAASSPRPRTLTRSEGRLDEPGGDEVLDADLRLGDPGQAVEVDDGVFGPEDVGEAALRDAADEGHLAALEVALAGIAAALELALAAAAGRLAPAGAGPAADPLAVLSRAFGGFQVAEVHGFSDASTFRTWAILRTMPSVSGDSRRTTQDCGFLRPSPRATSRWLRGWPTRLRTRVIFR